MYERLIHMLNLHQLEPVQEKFVGKDHKEFRIIENELKKQIKLIRDNYKTLRDRATSQDGSPILQKTDTTHLNKSDFNVAIERQFKSLFGLKSFTLLWTYKGILNAYTMPKIVTLFDKGPDQKGMYKNDKMHVTVVIDVSLIIYTDVDEKEVTALTLHEIGHNFYNSIFQTLMFVPMDIVRRIPFHDLSTIEKINRIITDAVSVSVYSGFGALYLKVKQALSQSFNKVFPKVTSFFSLINELSLEMQQTARIGSLMNIVQMIITRGKNPLSYISPRMLFGYNVEKFSDSMAADYGYGVDLAKALDKLTNPSETIQSDNWIYDLAEVPLYIIIHAIDEHPGNQNRIRTMLDRLRRSMNDPDLDPKLKKQLKGQIDEYEEYYKKYVNIEGDERKRKVFTWLSRVGIEKMFNGKMDIRELLYAIDPKKYK
jgi:hypothetical protein